MEPTMMKNLTVMLALVGAVLGWAAWSGGQGEAQVGAGSTWEAPDSASAQRGKDRKRDGGRGEEDEEDYRSSTVPVLAQYLPGR
jgi:hypothetical protein